MTCARPVFALLLALLVATTSGSMAVARGQAGIAGQVVLCTGTGPVAVNVDANGQPVGPAHICPDCVMSLIAAVAAPVPGAVFVPHAVRVRFFETARVALRARAPRPRARAPPVV